MFLSTRRISIICVALAASTILIGGCNGPTKAGLEALVHAWAAETQQGKLRVNLYDPGATRTQMRFDAMPGEDPETLPTPETVASPLCDLVEAGETRTNERVAFRDL